MGHFENTQKVKERFQNNSNDSPKIGSASEGSYSFLRGVIMSNQKIYFGCSIQALHQEGNLQKQTQQSKETAARHQTTLRISLNLKLSFFFCRVSCFAIISPRKSSRENNVYNKSARRCSFPETRR